jgi:hypothetical protein
MIRNATAQPPPIEEAIGARKAGWWHRLHASLDATYAPLTEKWSYYAKADRWSLQVKRQKGQRTILYMVLAPRREFLVAFLLGEKAVAAARAAPLPPEVLEAIDTAPIYPEGRLVWLTITRAAHLDHVTGLAAIKMAAHSPTRP